MDTLQAEVSAFAGLQDLKPLLHSPGPCISIYLPLAAANPKANALAWREVLQQLRQPVEAFGVEAQTLLTSLDGADNILHNPEPHSQSISVFRSPSIFHVNWLAEPVALRGIVGAQFFIRPLLPALAKPNVFYLLALSQKDVRLLRCTQSSSAAVPLPSAVATSYDTYMNSAQPDHASIDRTSAGPSAGHTKGIVASYDTTRESKSDYLAHFFRQVDRGLNETLRGSVDPLVLAGVDYELAQYRSLNTYPHLTDSEVHGAPNSLKSGEMHARALDALASSADTKADAILAEYNHKVGGGASNRLKDIVTAAHDGRILKLLVSDSLETAGVFDEASHTVSGRTASPGEHDDLLNDAAVQTLLHAGEVLSLPNQKIPNGAPAAAIFRY